MRKLILISVLNLVALQLSFAAPPSTTNRPLSVDANGNALPNVNVKFGAGKLWSNGSTIDSQLAAKQPLDGDLTAVAALATDSFGLQLLTKTTAPAIRSYIGAGTSSFDGVFSSLTGTPTTLVGYGITDAQPLDADLTAVAALATDSFGLQLLTKTSASAIRTYISLGNVENTALSTWPGSTNITTLGTVTTGNISASLLTSGTLPDARLSSNVPLKNASNTFTQPQTINTTTNGTAFSVSGESHTVGGFYIGALFNISEEFTSDADSRLFSFRLTGITKFSVRKDGVIVTGTIPESSVNFTDITTNNVSTTNHGYAPKLPNDATKYLDGIGAYSVPAGAAQIGVIGITIDGAGSVITTGSKGYISIPYNATVNNWTVLADQSGSIVVDVKKSTYSGFPTTSTIAGSEKPTLSSAQKNQDTSLTSFSTSVTAGDVWEFNVDSASTVTRCVVEFKVTK